MLRPANRNKVIRRRRKDRSGNCYEKMMKTLLLQNQQIIIQQQNMMFMVMKQFQHPPNSPPTAAQATLNLATTTNTNSSLASQPQQQQQQPQQTHQQLHHHHHHQADHHQQQQHQQQQQQTPQQHNLHQLQSSQYHHEQHIHHDEQSLHLFSQAATPSSQHPQQSIQDTPNHQLQQVCSQLQENLGNYLTPAASEQDPINDKPEDDDLVALLEGDGLLHNNLLYNPQTDIGSVTPYKTQPPQHQTPSYYSSGCESLTTPRVDQQQRQPTTTNINQNVVKNLADSFKSPSKPKINVQILSGSAKGSMKNSKAKIIQRMNISEFLRHVHPETEEPQKSSTQ